jgi:hypothetical protein
LKVFAIDCFEYFSITSSTNQLSNQISYKPAGVCFSHYHLHDVNILTTWAVVILTVDPILFEWLAKKKWFQADPIVGAAGKSSCNGANPRRVVRLDRLPRRHHRSLRGPRHRQGNVQNHSPGLALLQLQYLYNISFQLYPS